MTHQQRTPFIRQCAGPTPGRIYHLSVGHHIIGRDPEASVQIDDADVSRHHARIEVTNDGILINDLDSKNGVFRGGEQITQPTLFSDGERFELGKIILEVHHPGSQVAQALARAGEVTMTTTTAIRAQANASIASMASKNVRIDIRIPLISTILFALIIVALLLSE